MCIRDRFFGEHPRGRGGHRGPALLRPQRRDEVFIPQTDALFLKSPAQRFHHGRAYAKAVCCQGAALRQRFGQPVFHCGHAGLGHAHQLNAAARKLAPGLDKVAPIRPQGGLVFRHAQSARRCLLYTSRCV